MNIPCKFHQEPFMRYPGNKICPDGRAIAADGQPDNIMPSTSVGRRRRKTTNISWFSIRSMLTVARPRGGEGWGAWTPTVLYYHSQNVHKTDEKKIGDTRYIVTLLYALVTGPVMWQRSFLFDSSNLYGATCAVQMTLTNDRTTDGTSSTVGTAWHSTVFSVDCIVRSAAVINTALWPSDRQTPDPSIYRTMPKMPLSHRDRVLNSNRMQPEKKHKTRDTLHIHECLTNCTGV